MSILSILGSKYFWLAVLIAAVIGGITWIGIDIHHAYKEEARAAELDKTVKAQGDTISKAKVDNALLAKSLADQKAAADQRLKDNQALIAYNNKLNEALNDALNKDTSPDCTFSNSRLQLFRNADSAIYKSAGDTAAK